MTDSPNGHDGGEGGEGVEGSETYEMLWDCPHCGTKKLLGLTHRHCPNCGAPQDADKRYFPPDDEKVAVTDHVYYGKDIVCKYCGAYNSRNSKHCRECGSPAEEGTDAQTRETDFHAEGQYGGEKAQAAAMPAAGSPEKKKSKTGLFIVLGIVAAVVALIVVFLAWKRDASFEVAGHEWKREIDIEQFGTVKESDWCDRMPRRAKETRRYRAVRKHEKVKVGEDCKVKKVDKGDGTFKQVKKCTPKYDNKPIEDDKCDFMVDKWKVFKTETASGSSLTPAPQWPAVDTGAACTRPGCKRAGPKRESYTVKLRGADGSDECELSQSRWSSLSVGKKVKAEVRMMGGGIDCDSIK
jgi:hypothetical protein